MFHKCRSKHSICTRKTILHKNEIWALVALEVYSLTFYRLLGFFFQIDSSTIADNVDSSTIADNVDSSTIAGNVDSSTIAGNVEFVHF